MKKNSFTTTQYMVLFILACIGLIVVFAGGVFILNDLNSASTNIKIPAPTSKPPTAVSKNYMVGTWSDNLGIPCTITIKKVNGSYKITRLYNDGSGGTNSLFVQIVNGRERFIEYPNNPTGDYIVILDNGNLAFYDNEGFIYEAYPK